MTKKDEKMSHRFRNDNQEWHCTHLKRIKSDFFVGCRLEKIQASFHWLREIEEIHKNVQQGWKRRIYEIDTGLTDKKVNIDKEI